MLLLSHLVMFICLRPRGLQPTRLLCPWDSAGKNTGVGSHVLLQGIFPTQGLNPHLLPLISPALTGVLFCFVLFLPLAPPWEAQISCRYVLFHMCFFSLITVYTEVINSNTVVCIRSSAGQRRDAVPRLLWPLCPRPPQHGSEVGQCCPQRHCPWLARRTQGWPACASG